MFGFLHLPLKIVNIVNFNFALDSCVDSSGRIRAGLHRLSVPHTHCLAHTPSSVCLPPNRATVITVRCFYQNKCSQTSEGQKPSYSLVHVCATTHSRMSLVCVCNNTQHDEPQSDMSPGQRCPFKRACHPGIWMESWEAEEMKVARQAVHHG